MSDEKLGPKPEPEAEAPALNPGGADAINADAPFEGDERANLGRDLNPELNPEVEDQVPDEITDLEDKQQEGEGDGATTPEKEDPV